MKKSDFDIAQGSIEYLIVIGIIILLSLIIVGLTSNYNQREQDDNTNNN